MDSSGKDLLKRAAVGGKVKEAAKAIGRLLAKGGVKAAKLGINPYFMIPAAVAGGALYKAKKERGARMRQSELAARQAMLANYYRNHLIRAMYGRR